MTCFISAARSRAGRLVALLALLFVMTVSGSSAPAAITWPDDLVDPPSASQPTPVEMSVYLDDVSRIDVFSHTFSATAQLVMEWRDPRIIPVLAAQRGGHKEEVEGAAVLDVLRHIWHPALEVSNEQGQRRVGVRALELHPDGRIKLYEKFDSVPRLEGDMHLFPFVTAKLRLAFSAVLQDRGELELIGRRFEFEAGENAESVIVGHWNFVSLGMEAKTAKRSDVPETLYPRLDFVVTVDRHVFSGFATFILPMVLIALVSIALLWLDPAAAAAYAGPRVGGTLTLILTTVALQLTLRPRLPNVHHLVLPDYLFYLIIVMLTVSIFQSCAYAHLSVSGKKDTARYLDRTTKIAFPLAFLVLATAVVLASLSRIG